VLGADGVNVAQAELAKIFGFGGHGCALNLVDGEEYGLAAADEELDEIVVGAGQLRASIDDEDKGVGLLKCDFGLVVDFGGNQLGVVRDDATGVDQAKLAAAPVVLAVDPVAGNARLVAHDGAARVRQAIEKRRFAHVGPAHDGDHRQRLSARFAGYYRPAIRRQNESPVAESPREGRLFGGPKGGNLKFSPTGRAGRGPMGCPVECRRWMAHILWHAGVTMME